ncbi:MAG: hypothetical protein ACJAW8_001613 [Oleispira sp.]|jgi:hypothetical protein
MDHAITAQSPTPLTIGARIAIGTFAAIARPVMKMAALGTIIERLKVFR